MTKRDSQDLHTAISETRRRYWLLCLVAAVAFLATIVLVQLWKDGGNDVPPPVFSSPRVAVAERAPTEAIRGKITVRANPAEQKAGPPDPLAQRSAANSAARAAVAAAKLAVRGADQNN